MSNYPFIKLYVSPRCHHLDFEDNSILGIRSYDYGFLELIFWHGLFEIYYRPFSKRYGYFVTSFFDLTSAIGFLKTPRVELGRFLPGTKDYADKSAHEHYFNQDAQPWPRKK